MVQEFLRLGAKIMMKLDRKNVEEILALTPMQEGMLFHYLKDPCSDYYFEQLNLDISSEIDQGRFEKAWNFVIETNDMLRAVFRWEKVENPIQIILKEHKFYPTYYDFSNKTSAEAKRQLETVKAKDREEKFDLKEVPFRVTLCKVKEDKYEMIISNHHILYDGWSNGIILREFFKAYYDLCNGRELVKPVKTKFKEFVKWIQNRDINKDKKFWEEYLNGFEPKTGIPAETKRIKTKEIKNTGTYRLKFPDELKEPLGSFTGSQKVPLSVLLYSAWGVLLQEYNSREDMVYDTTVSGRSAKLRGIEEIVGLFINTVPLRVKVSSGERTADFISRMAAAIRQREEFENSSLLDIKEYFDGSNNGILFDSVVIIENYPLDKKLMQGRELSVFERTGYDLTVIITTFDDIEIHFIYNKGLFDEEIIAGLSGHFVQVVRAFIENPREKISGINIVLEEEKSRILNNLKRCREIGWGTGIEYTYKAPGNELEERLAGVWASVLKVEKSRIGIDTNFFDFGGHSLKATLLSAGIHKEFGVKVSLGDVFRFPTIGKLAGYIRKSKERKGEDRYVPVKPVEKKEYYRVAPAQRRLYMLQQLNPESTVYNGPLIMLPEGLIDKEHTALSFKRLIQRHEMLRTSFVQQDGEPVQKIHEFDEVEFEIEYFNLTAKTREGTRIKEESFIIHHFVRAFDLSKAPLLRVGLVKIEEQKHFLMIDMHHIVTDGTSRDILTGEFASLYNGEALSPLKIQYKEYSEWQNERMLKGKLKVHEEFWLRHLSGELPVLNLPTDFPRPVMQGFDGERIVFELAGSITRQLHMLMKETGTTLYMVLMSLYSILLGWYSGQEDILVGVPIAGRNHADLEDAVGLFLETLVIRNQPLGDKTFEQVLREVKDTALRANEHQDYPFSELVKRVAAAKMNDLSRNPLFDAMLNVLNQNNSDLEIEGVQILPYTFDAKVSKVDMTLEAMEVDDGEGDKIRLELEYCTSLFKRATMERFIGHFLNVLREAVLSGIF
jgi:acyl carrier protein/NRPS condensation-like uncharacterized protein